MTIASTSASICASGRSPLISANGCLLLLFFLMLVFPVHAELLVKDTFSELSASATKLGSWRLDTWPPGQRGQVTAEVVEIPSRGKRIQLEVRQLIPRGGVILARSQKFRAGHIYSLSVELSATESTVPVRVSLRRADAHYDAGAIDISSIGTTQSKITVRGGFPEDTKGVIAIQPLGPGQVQVGSIELHDITLEIFNSTEAYVRPQDETPRSFFGVHINKLGKHNTWPAADFGLLRLWDTGTTWADLAPTPGSFQPEKSLRSSPDRSRLDYYLKHKAKHCPRCAVMYTMAVTPDWAASDPSAIFPGYKGSSTPPLNSESWKNYVATMIARYGSRIQYWEMWNEADIPQHFKGPDERLFSMVESASEIIRAADKDLKISSPNITVRGLGLLDSFLKAGGGKHVDFISWHLYASAYPELDVPTLVAMHDVLHRNDSSHLPVFNTEGRLTSRGVEKSSSLTQTEIVAAVARTYLVQWAFNIDSFSWYMWDDTSKAEAKLNASGPPKFEGVSQSGQALRQVMKWLTGAALLRREVTTYSGGQQLWRLYTRAADGRPNLIVWSTKGETPVHLPGRHPFKTIQTLDGENHEAEDATIETDISPVRMF